MGKEMLETGYLVSDCALLYGSLTICLAAAGLWDKRSRRIPNWWITFWYAAGFFYFVRSGWLAAAGYLVRTAGAVGFLFLFFLCRMAGAGDLKCMALICGYLGFSSGVRVIGLGMVTGALMSLFKLRKKGVFQQRIRYLAAYFRQVFQEKKIIAYYVPERDGREVTIPFVSCLFFGLVIFCFYCFLLRT